MKNRNRAMLYVIGGAVAGLLAAGVSANFSHDIAAALPLWALLSGCTGGYVGAKLYQA